MVEWKICVKIRDVTRALFRSFPGFTKTEMLHDQPRNGVWTLYKQMYFFSSKTYRISHTTLPKTEMIKEQKAAWRNVFVPCTKKGNAAWLLSTHEMNSHENQKCKYSWTQI
jgi:hypothetical protein